MSCKFWRKRPGLSAGQAKQILSHRRRRSLTAQPRSSGPFFSFSRLHEQLNESEQAAQCYIKYIQDIYSCSVRWCLGNKGKCGVELPWKALEDDGFPLITVGVSGACGGQHCLPLPGPILLQVQALGWSLSMCSAMLCVQWCEYLHSLWCFFLEDWWSWSWLPSE